MFFKEFDEKVKVWINEHKDEILTEWMELVKIPSVISDPCKNAPFGENCAKALRAVYDLYKKHGFEAEIYENDGYALARYGSGNKTIGLFAHSDVVPVGDGWTYTQPFEPIIKDNTMIGRGCEDNKSGIMLSLCLMRMIKELNLLLKNKLQAFTGSNEESGMADIEAFKKSQPMPELSFVPDAEFPCSIGEKGIYRMYAAAPREFEDIADFYGGEAFNLVLDKATVKINYKKELEAELCKKLSDEYELTSDKEYITLTAKGIAKHASIPEGSVNAGYLAAKILCECDSLCDNDKNILTSCARLLESGFGEGANMEHTDEIFGRLTMVNGIISTENNKLKLSFDIRYGSSLPASDAEKRAHSGIEALGWTYEDVENMEGFSIAKDSMIPDVLVETYNEMTGFEKDKITMAGGTYARFLKNAFSVGTYTDFKGRESKPLAMPAGHGGAHEKDEKIDLDEFFFALRILMQYIIQADSLI